MVRISRIVGSRHGRLCRHRPPGSVSETGRHDGLVEVGNNRQFMGTDDLVGSTFRLSPIQLANKNLFDSAFSRIRQPLTDYTFASTFMWGGSLALYWSILDRHLCVFANGTGDLTMLMPPISLEDARDGDARDCLANCFEIMDQYNDRVSDRSHSRIEYVSDDFLARVRDTFPISVQVTPMSGDYVYDMARMIDLAGGNLKSKRHARSKFMREYPDHRTETLRPEHVEGCLELLERWCRHGDACHLGEVSHSNVATDILRHRDYHATRRALQTFEDLQLTGMVLFVGEILVGFTLGEAISKSQASILIEKTHPEYHGSAQFIFSEFCRQYWSHLSECNVGDDWGIPSLQFTKESYRPIRMLAKHMLAREPIPMVAGFEFEPPIVAGRIEAALETPPPPSLDPTFRRASIEDIPAILALEQLCFHSASETFNRRQIRNLISSPRAVTMIAEVGKEVVGWSAGLVRQHREHRTGRLYNVAVHPGFRGMRIGHQLVRHSLGVLANAGATGVFLEVREDNHVAIRLYHRLGFVDHHVLPDYYGPGVHARSMQLSNREGGVLSERIPERAAV